MSNEVLNPKLEIIESDARKRLAREFPAFSLERFLLVDNQSTRLIIDDVSYQSQVPVDQYIDLLLASCKGQTDVYRAQDLIRALNENLGRSLEKSQGKTTIMMFPMNGALVIKNLLGDNFEDYPLVDVQTQRRIDMTTGATLGVDISNQEEIKEILSRLEPENIIIVDDVIVTGSTLRAIKNAFSIDSTSQWYACSLMALSPLQNRQRSKTSPSSIEGYDSINAVVVYQGLSGTPAVNSLSTLIGDSDKSNAVRSRYMVKYVDDQGGFLNTVELIKQQGVKL